MLTMNAFWTLAKFYIGAYAPQAGSSERVTRLEKMRTQMLLRTQMEEHFVMKRDIGLQYVAVTDPDS